MIAVRFKIIRRLSLILLLFYLNSKAEDKVEPARDDTIAFSLQEALLTGLQNNPTVTIQRLVPAILQTYVKESQGQFLPTLDATAQQVHSKSQRLLGTRPDPIELEDDRYSYTVSINEFLPTGTNVSLSASQLGALSSLYRDQFTGTFNLSINQPLLNGFGLSTNLATLRKARLDWQISQAELKGLAEEVVADIEKSYWELYLAVAEIIIQQKSLELAEKHLMESWERVRVGKLPELEIAAVEAELAARHSQLLNAQSQGEQAKLRFLYLLNPQQDLLWSRPLRLTDQPFLPVDTLAPLSIHVQLGKQFRADLQQAKLNYQKGILEVHRTRNGMLPQLDFFITFGTTSYAQSFKDVKVDVNSPYRSATTGLSLALPALNRSQRAQYTRAKLTQKQQEIALQNMEKLVEVEIRSAYAEVQRARQQIEATKRTRELQEKKLNAELEKFRIGKSTNLLVLQAQRDFISSQLEETRTMVAYLTALTQLYLKEGTLLERRGIASRL